MKNIVLIGSGAWGKNYISTFAQFPNVKLKVANRNNWKSLINEYPDGVIIATPPDSHIDIAAYVLEKNIPVIIEKPLSLSLKEAQLLQHFSVPILVNHIHLFSDAYRHFKKMIDPNKITSIRSYFIGEKRHDYSLLWDYSPHGISLTLDLLNQTPTSLEVLPGNIYHIDMSFKNCQTKVSTGVANRKQTEYYIEADGITYHYNDLLRPKSHKTPLYNMVNVFLKVLNGKSDYRIGLDLSLKTLEIIEKLENKLNE